MEIIFVILFLILFGTFGVLGFVALKNHVDLNRLYQEARHRDFIRRCEVKEEKKEKQNDPPKHQ